MNNNPFFEDQEERRSNLKQILEYEEESQQEKSIGPSINITNTAD